MLSPIFRSISILTVLVAAGAGFAGDSDERIDFNSQIRPILSDRCFACHGPDEQIRAKAGGLRLDTFEGATAFLKDGRSRAITPGRPDQSVLLMRIRSHDPQLRMPPPDFKLTVSEEEAALLERWIAQGAEYTAHWAFVTPRRPELPAVKNGAWVRDDLDRFVLAKLERKGLSPAPEADRETLIRRVTLDLTGLPPTLEEIDAFLADQSPDAYEKVVDRLLASPHYGERMAAGWLDLARYADTFGYQTDPYRDVWPYRDWVIKAFNDNLPYDKFITWQLAGDLLPNATREQRLATLFNRLHRQTAEGGSIEEEFRVEYVADRVHTFGTTMLGLTLECARCHDHKYDPISMEEYYQLFAFFQNIDEPGLLSHFTQATPPPSLMLSTPEQDRQLEMLRKRVAEAEKKLHAVRAARRNAFAAWLASGDRQPVIPGLIGDYPLEAPVQGKIANRADESKPGAMHDNPQFVSGRVGQAVKLSGDNHVRFPGVGAFRRWDPFSFSVWMKPADAYDRAVVFHHSRAWTDSGSQGYQVLIEDGHLTWSIIHFWPGNAISIRTKQPVRVNDWQHVVVTYDGSCKAAGLAIYIDGERADTEVVRDNLYKNIHDGSHTLTLGERFRDRGFKDGMLDEFKVFNRELTAIEARELFQEGTLAAAMADRSQPAQRAALYDYYLANHDEAYRNQLAALREARQQLATLIDSIRDVMTMQELPEPKPAYVLERGSYEARGKRVYADTPRIFPPMPANAPRNRLGLAQWLTDPAHPLTARVAVNRLWAVAFGRGLVSTAENFGSQGELPANPELMDYLAVEFVASGWDMKAMLRRIVTSATYRQSSRASLEHRLDDPNNTLFAHGPLKRLTAEMLRDQALAASGLLVPKIGGPSVKPYQPAGLWSSAGASGGDYVPDKGEGLYRRSLYSFWKSTMPPPTMLIFDAAQRDVCIARRQTTNTPLQALVLLNDPQFVEAARLLAERVMLESNDDATRITRAFRRMTARQPTERERRVFIELYEAQLDAMRRNPSDVEALLKVGDRPPSNKVDHTELAAMTIVCSTIMNHDAAIVAR